MRCQKEGLSEVFTAVDDFGVSSRLAKLNISLAPCQAFREPAETLLAPAEIGAMGEAEVPSALVGHFGIEIFGIVIWGSEMLGQLTGKNPSFSSPVSVLPTAVCTPSSDVGVEALMT
jgi:hypothetical protein